ncbi:Polysaccharide biosynthesis protein [Arthrobacter saudimassiliensis]|uniref:Polysaccharide biosynthesis protein n=1 Tax=Arthrobacter saudimassiliensis TaxID=1461584 RepID=A0A078MRN2_9MICC|nr:Polysaccharide biosynthesis protein [Arthrobacter saudimassiliensis]
MTAAPAARSLSPSLVRTAALSLILVVSGSGLALLTTLVVSNLLGEEGAGRFFQVAASYAILIALCTMGSDTGMVRFISATRAVQGPGQERELLRIALAPVLVVGAALLIGLWLGAPALSRFLDAGPEGAIALRLAGPLIFGGVIMTVLFGALRGSQHVLLFAFLQNLLLPTLRLGAVTAAITLGAGLGLLAVAWGTPMVLVAVVAGLALRRAIDHDDRATRLPSPTRPSGTPTRRSFWSFSGARGVSAALEALLEWFGVLAVAFLLGPAAAGIYGVANRCIRLAAMVDHTIRIVSGPTISAALAVNDVPAAVRLYNSMARLMVLGAWPLYLTYVLFAPSILAVFGTGFESGVPLFTLVAAAMLLTALAGGVQSVLLMSGRSRWQLINKSAALATAVTLTFILVPRIGLLGAGLAWAGAVLLDTGLAALQVRRVLGPAQRLRAVVLPVVLAASVFGVGGLATRALVGQSLSGLGIHLAASACLYAILLYAMRRPLGLIALRRDV